jgi:AraC-like DNA-binding protein
MPKDTYSGWAILAPGTGGFEAAVGRSTRTPTNMEWIAAGDLILCPPGQVLHRRIRSPIAFHFIEIDWLDTGHPGFSEAENRLRGRLTGTQPGRLLSTLNLLGNLRATPQAETPEGRLTERYVTHLVTDIVLDCVRVRFTLPQPEAGDPKAHDAARIIHDQFAKPLQLGDLASRLSISPSQLTRRFRRTFGVPPIEYLTRTRVEQAARLLTSGDATLDEIAQSCGYAGGFYLSRVFSKVMGVPPSVYRRDHGV